MTWRKYLEKYCIYDFLMFNIITIFYTQILNSNSIKKYNLPEISIINYLVSS